MIPDGDYLDTALNVWLLNPKDSDAGLHPKVMNTWRRNVKSNMATLIKFNIVLHRQPKLLFGYVRSAIAYPLYDIYELNRITYDSNKHRIEMSSNCYTFQSGTPVLAINEFVSSKDVLIYNKLIKIDVPSIPDKLAKNMILPKELFVEYIFDYLPLEDIYKLLAIFD